MVRKNRLIMNFGIIKKVGFMLRSFPVNLFFCAIVRDTPIPNTTGKQQKSKNPGQCSGQCGSCQFFWGNLNGVAVI